MSLYDLIPLERPAICYAALHQVREGTKTDDYVKTMLDLHKLVAEHSASITNAMRTKVEDLAAVHRTKVTNRLHRLLSAPIPSASDEIGNILREEYAGLAGQLIPTQRFGLHSATEGKVVPMKWSTTRMKELLERGASYLSELGFERKETGRDVFESNFVVDGAMNLDIIEHIVRDRVGIYTPVHGKHIKEFDSYAYAAFNLVYESGEWSHKIPYEAALFFSKGEPKYAPFRNALSGMFDAAVKELNVPHCTLWQRKLGLGVGKEFVLRLRIDSIDTVAEFIEFTASYPEKSFARDAMLASGHLVIKEMIPLQ
jgi:hypothetical protein